MSSADTAAEATAEAGQDQATAARETDEVRETLLASFADELGEALVGSHIDPGHDLWVRVDREAWTATHELARDGLEFRFFEFLSGIDWLPSPYGRYEDSEIDLGAGDREMDTTIVTGHAGGDTRFQVFSRLFDVRRRHMGVIFKVDVPDEDLTVASLTGLFPGANWHEREVAEMYGIAFDGHPYLQHLYLPTDFEGHPLRKDYPLVSRIVKPWPGIVDVEVMPESADEAEAQDEQEEAGS